ncbi:hypothetical protein ABIB62_003274 [Mucilaginibacter sp. UYP25]
MLAFLIIISIVAMWSIRNAVANKPKAEWTEWEHHRDTTPIKSTLPDGNRVFQNQSHWRRYNRNTKQWESKRVVDPIQRPFNQATSLSDVYNLRFEREKINI